MLLHRYHICLCTESSYANLSLVRSTLYWRGSGVAEYRLDPAADQDPPAESTKVGSEVGARSTSRRPTSLQGESDRSKGPFRPWLHASPLLSPLFLPLGFSISVYPLTGIADSTVASGTQWPIDLVFQGDTPSQLLLSNMFSFNWPSAGGASPRWAWSCSRFTPVTGVGVRPLGFWKVPKDNCNKWSDQMDCSVRSPRKDYGLNISF